MSYYSLEPLKRECERMNVFPYLRIICGNRTSGKTTAAIMESLNIFKDRNKQTIFLYRTKAELRASHYLYEDVIELYPDYNIERVETKPLVSELIYGVYAYIDGEAFLIAFSVWIKKPDKIKKFSPMFKDVELGIFDEFLVEDEKEYLENEVLKIQSICISIGRGGGKQSRPFYLYLIANRTNLCNPYFVHFGILEKIQKNTKFIRGNGIIVEFSFNESAQKALSDNALVNALTGNDDTYINYASGAGELYVSGADVIKKLHGKNRYYATFFIDGKGFSVREFYEDDACYISDKIDESCGNVYFFNSKGKNLTNVYNKAFLLYLHKMYKNGILFYNSADTRARVLTIVGRALFR